MEVGEQTTYSSMRVLVIEWRWYVCKLVVSWGWGFYMRSQKTHEPVVAIEFCNW